MSKVIVPLDKLGPAQLARFRELTSAPPVAWPTVILCAVLTVTFVSVYWFCGSGQWPLWLGTLLNTVVGYVAFSVAHDAIHRAVSTDTRLNDRVGQLGITLVLPYIDIRMFRWAHILHHRFASGPRDPDRVFNGAWWSLPFRWMAIDLCYFVYALQNGDKVSKPFLRACLWRLALFATVIAALVWAGYGMEVLMLWFLPSRLIQLMLGFSFFWLPHVPHDVSQEENFTRATTIRRGHEWFLGPVLQYQNYHLIHHLYPMTPFYNNGRVYQVIETELQRKELAVQHGFAIRPTIHPGAATRA
ncbi:MAG TPA: fatty acid desaturase [Solimonas sp.]|nr:fatty acid desaturase [Solimonas sp.]